MTAPIELAGSSGFLDQDSVGDGSTAGATGGGIFGEGVSQSQRVELGAITVGGITVPAWPFAATPATRGAAWGIAAALAIGAAVYLIRRKG